MLLKLYDFQGFDAKSKCCAHCGVLRAMEVGLVHVDEMLDEGGCHPGLHLVCYAPYHLGNVLCSDQNYAQRFTALKPSLPIVWECLLKRWGWAEDMKLLNMLLVHDYWWSDLSVVNKVVTDARDVSYSVYRRIVNEVNQRWMASCRRAWLAAVLCN